MTNKYTGYKCSLCDAQFGPEEVVYTCPKDGGNLNVLLDYEEIRRRVIPNDIFDSDEPSLWRYLPLLPVLEPGGQSTPLWRAGWTPVYSATSLGESIGLQNLFVKDESFNPTASFKDRASAVIIARAREIGAEVVVTASTGNAGAALAGMAAAVDHRAVIFAPKTAPPAKIAQLLVYGAQVLLVDGNYDQAISLALEASKEFGWYCRNTGYNPFTIEGKKTAAYEIWEFSHRVRLEAGEILLFVSVGDGNIISGLHKGFKELHALGWIENVPRIFGVQSEGSAAIANTYFAGTEKIKPVIANTLADSISVDMPSDGVRAVRAATQTGGSYFTVRDDQILKAMANLGKVGIFAEPAGATAYAGLVKAVEQGQIHASDPVLVINTGSGLKDVKAAMEAVSEAPIIEPSLEAVKLTLNM